MGSNPARVTCEWIDCMLTKFPWPCFINTESILYTSVWRSYHKSLTCIMSMYYVSIIATCRLGYTIRKIRNQSFQPYLAWVWTANYSCFKSWSWYSQLSALCVVTLVTNGKQQRVCVLSTKVTNGKQQRVYVLLTKVTNGRAYVCCWLKSPMVSNRGYVRCWLKSPMVSNRGYVCCWLKSPMVSNRGYVTCWLKSPMVSNRGYVCCWLKSPMVSNRGYVCLTKVTNGKQHMCVVD